jgi:hypothetical protein
MVMINSMNPVAVLMMMTPVWFVVMEKTRSVTWTNWMLTGVVLTFRFLSESM